jgi:hypothetical protein
MEGHSTGWAGGNERASPPWRRRSRTCRLLPGAGCHVKDIHRIVHRHAWLCLAREEVDAAADAHSDVAGSRGRGMRRCSVMQIAASSSRGHQLRPGGRWHCQQRMLVGRMVWRRARLCKLDLGGRPWHQGCSAVNKLDKHAGKAARPAFVPAAAWLPGPAPLALAAHSGQPRPQPHPPKNESCASRAREVHRCAGVLEPHMHVGYKSTRGAVSCAAAG